MKTTSRHRLGLCLLGAALVLAACFDNLTSPRHAKPIVGEQISGPTASRSTVNSPQTTTVTLGSLNVENGSASATASTTYPYPTIVKAKATGVISKTARYHLYYWYNAYPSGSQLFYPQSDSYLGMIYQGIGRTIGFPTANGADSSASSYVLVRAGETVTGAGRNYKSNEVWNPGCGPNYNQCYIYCGGWYPPSCFILAAAREALPSSARPRTWSSPSIPAASRSTPGPW